MEKLINWCIEKHKNTNHFYDTYLPYEFHLRMVANVAKDFIALYESGCDGDVESCIEDIMVACWGHDLIEDCRVSYNDVKNMLGESAANIVYAVSNEKGKNRKERANAKYYKGIRETQGAVFVKLCDRIANVQYSKMTKSRMFEMYQKENIDFMVQLGWVEHKEHPYEKMFKYLINLFRD